MINARKFIGDVLNAVGVNRADGFNICEIVVDRRGFDTQSLVRLASIAAKGLGINIDLKETEFRTARLSVAPVA